MSLLAELAWAFPLAMVWCMVCWYLWDYVKRWWRDSGQ